MDMGRENTSAHYLQEFSATAAIRLTNILMLSQHPHCPQEVFRKSVMHTSAHSRDVVEASPDCCVSLASPCLVILDAGICE